MLLQTQSLTTHLSLPLPPSKPTPKILSFTPIKQNPFRRTRFRALRCSLSAVSEPTQLETKTHKPVAAEVSRTIMELVSVGTLSTLTQEGWPLGIGVRFAVDLEGTPVLCLNASNRQFSIDRRSSFHVQLEQSGLRTPQCTILGSIDKPENRAMLKYLHSVWKKRFGEEVDEDLIYVVSVERVLQLEDFKEVGMWVTSSDYKNAQPDPLRDFAVKLVNEINTNNIEDINRFCNIYADLNFQVSEAKLVWVDRLGFDLHLWSPQEGIFEVRIPFSREVTDEKGANPSKKTQIFEMGYAQLVIGPAGSGKSTYCSSLHEHCTAIGRSINIVNLDPAAENFDYPVAMDIRELVSLEDVMEELGLGPNGGLLYCMEHLEDNLDEWLMEELDNYTDDDYLVFDCPGQIELFSHVPVLRNFVEHLQRKNFKVCVVYLLDSQFITDVTKFISGCMASLSAMIQLELPHVNILSKMDLAPRKKDIEDFLYPEPQVLLSELNQRMAPQFAKLNKSLIELVDDYSMVSFLPLDLRKSSSMSYVLAQIDTCIQFGEDADVKVKEFDQEEDD
ncbi:hypothetical protein D8674_035587 [Pyrus ussuriensis x Pyrus communis]|uniref:GPN-loop GTPase 3 n=1 Tax=Pyrus ussuriensis x Pyrus communis TaxID=2448454 RepID=A0A5N5GHH6_9ROSA|nr:hypothetical protein D8674_035587 [Pyrus ussuriensis x Pyrus communis]